MKPFTVKQKSAQAGSNTRSKKLAVQRAEVYEKLRRPFVRLANAYRRQVKQLISKAERRLAAEIADRVRDRYHQTNLKAGAAARKWDANHAKVRAELRRELTRAIPGYRQWEALAKAHRREYNALVTRELAALVDRRVHVNLGSVLLPDAGETYEFTSPFAVYQTDISYDDDAEVEDLSLTVPDRGYLVNRLHSDHEYQPLVITDIYGINWMARHRSTTACGINFTTPAAGKLRIAATLQNFYNNIVVSVRDRFGFSQAVIRVHVRLVISISRPSQVSEYSTTLIYDGYDSFGREETYQFPSLDSSSPYVFETTTEEVFPANAGLQILAGTEIYITSEIDDMTTHVDALLGWQLQKIAINIV